MPVTDGPAVQNLRSLDQILIHTARAACNHALIGVEFSVADLVCQRRSGTLELQGAGSVLLHHM